MGISLAQNDVRLIVANHTMKKPPEGGFSPKAELLKVRRTT